VRAGRLDEARTLHHALAPLVAALFAEPNPAPLKAVLAQRGFGTAALRPPLTPASAEALHAVLAAVAFVDRSQGGDAAARPR